MKKIFFILLIGSIFALGADNSDIEKKLDLLIEKMGQMEKRLNSKDKEIESLKKEVSKEKLETKKHFNIQSCSNVKVKSFNFTYHKDVKPYYNITFTLVNKYPYPIRKVVGRIDVKDKDGVTLITDYFARNNINIAHDQEITVEKVHIITSDLEKTMADENLNSLKTTFIPTQIIFTNGQQVSCGGIFSSSIF